MWDISILPSINHTCQVLRYICGTFFYITIEQPHTYIRLISEKDHSVLRVIKRKKVSCLSLKYRTCVHVVIKYAGIFLICYHQDMVTCKNGSQEPLLLFNRITCPPDIFDTR